MEIQASPRSVEVKCSDVLHCHLGKVTVSPSFLPSFCSGWPLPRPVPGGAACPGAVPVPVPRALSGAAPRRALKRRPARGPRAPLGPRAPHVPPGARDGPEGKGRRRGTGLTERRCDGDGGM